MGHSGLILVFWILGMALLGYVGSQELATEGLTGGQPWALCPADDSPAATREGQLLGQPRFSSCMLRCTSHAYEAYTAMLATGDFKSMTTSLKVNEGRQGPEHKFCWMLHLRCQRGVRLTKAFVLLNLEQPLDQSWPFPLRLLLSAPSWPQSLLQPRSKRRDTRLLNGEACGVRFDVTEPFRNAEGGRDDEMCVEVVCPEGDTCEDLQLSLRCPPFLATLWRSLPRPDG
ncbi:uncharacterized protein LOC113426335 [Notechis scutatus]|uniref:Uncharacterized protein LOC113426335 n=1 Tax=Notechis scutatus TaxID=8663 RepID=A0A6J1VMW8_9SAUR|nr:uncharacterized protein LOC113426335 [Notechis scutatus]